jgi:hypothetical protein
MRDQIKKVTRIVELVLIVGLLSGPAWTQTVSFTSTYTGKGSGAAACDTSFGIIGYEPASGRHPVFLYMVGTKDAYNANGVASVSVDGMANRGYVAASIEYENRRFGDCDQISGKTRCIFDRDSVSSAVGRLCARPSADCNKGIVVAGFSQGAVIGNLAKNYDSRVQAAWGMGDGVNYQDYDLAACVSNGSRKLASDHLRVVNGQNDQFLGGNASSVRHQMQLLTGFNCGASAYSCLQRNGSGWYLVRPSQTASGIADHPYLVERRTPGSRKILITLGWIADQSRLTEWLFGGLAWQISEPLLDRGWREGNDEWESNANMNWLALFTSH